MKHIKNKTSSPPPPSDRSSDRPLSYFHTWTAQNQAPAFELTRASGPFLFRADPTSGEEQRIFDLSSLSFQASFGHSPASIISKVKKQLDAFPLASPKAHFTLKEETAQRLMSHLSLGRGKIFFTLSGAESIENAAKVARDIRSRTVIVARRQAYHGASLGALSLSGDWRNKAHQSIEQWTLRIPEPNADPHAQAARQIIEDHDPKNIAGLCLEVISAGVGVFIPPASWWQGIQKIATDFHLPLILDEVATGFYRTGTALACQHYGVTPDMVCLSKAITGGIIPFGAVWIKEELADHYANKTLACGLTSYGHPLGLAATSAVLDRLEDKSFHQKRRQLEGLLQKWVDSLRVQQVVQKVRIKGLFCALDLEAHLSWEELLSSGLYAFVRPGVSGRGTTLILAPCFTYRLEELEEGLDRLRTLLERQRDLET